MKINYLILTFLLATILQNLNAQPGTLDSTFNGNGIVTTDFSLMWDQANAVAIQNDGKIVVAGTSDIAPNNSQFAISRYLTDRKSVV